MSTIGKKYLVSKFIGTVIWSWIDCEVQLHTKKFNNVLYLLDSTVNILGETSMAESMKDDEGTWVLTKIKYSIFTWYFGNYTNTIAH